MSGNDADDLFGSDDEEEEESLSTSQRDNELVAQQLLTILLSNDIKPKVKAASPSYWEKLVQKDLYLGKKVLIWKDENADNSNDLSEIIQNKLHLAGFDSVILQSFQSQEPIIQDYDVILSVNVSILDSVSSVWTQRIKEMQSRKGKCRVLMPGGIFAMVHSTSCEVNIENLFEERHWCRVEQSNLAQPLFTMLKKRAILCNETAAIYWTRDLSARPLKDERDLLEQLAVPLSVAERDQRVFSVSHRAQIVSNLQKYGMVVIPSLHKHDEKLAAAAEELVADMKDSLQFLKENHSVDLLFPRPDQELENFQELSLREHRRCDLRSTPRLAKLCPPPLRTSNVPTASMAQTSVRWTWPNIDVTYLQTKQAAPKREEYSQKDRLYEVNVPDARALGTSVLDELRLHPAMMSAIHESLCPRSTASAGNWGRWNFEGPGPEAPQTIAVGQPGVVFSFPGCLDQTIHADTPHLFEMPVSPPLAPHYLNYFLPMPRPESEGHTHRSVSNDVEGELAEIFDAREIATDGRELRGERVGQTAFVVGSHGLDVSKSVMAEENMNDLLSRLVRPMYFPGDALVFDCRILHFGLANQLPVMPAHITSLSESSPERLAAEHSWREEIIRDTSRWRPMVYINCTKDWFQDPKNWNNRRTIYSSM